MASNQRDSGKSYRGGSRRPSGVYAAPRRYSIALMMVVTTAFATLLTSVRMMFDLRPVGVISIFLFFVIVGVGQSLLLGGRRPRTASMICGAIALPIVSLLIALQTSSGRGLGWEETICMMFAGLVFGPPAGYLAGGLIGGVFLTCDQIANKLFPVKAQVIDEDNPFGGSPPPAKPESPVVAEVVRPGPPPSEQAE